MLRARERLRDLQRTFVTMFLEKFRPIHLKTANEFVRTHHRHSLPTVGGKFAVSCYQNKRLCGVAICGRPTARNADDGETLEIYRNCTDGTKNACSKLYGACIRIAKEMGYKRVITYTLASESGKSLKASNFISEGKAGLIYQTGSRQKSYAVSPPEYKIRYVIYLEAIEKGEKRC